MPHKHFLSNHNQFLQAFPMYQSWAESFFAATTTQVDCGILNRVVPSRRGWEAQQMTGFAAYRLNVGKPRGKRFQESIRAFAFQDKRLEPG
mmetsp:Transcript_20767/g.38804  ORF Transcript_20767/g.38804 Transcript_20767/m.38804 type:complete len:91 (-) Transcript_20767:791-1063(-)